MIAHNSENSLERILEIDSDDRRILTMVQENPDLTHAEIASKINKSQPAVGARILKLERKHLLESQYGIDLSSSKLVIGILTLYARNSKEVIDAIGCCPFVLNAFTTIGRTNMTVWLVATNIEKLEEIVENHFRARTDIRRVELSFVTEVARETILPVDLNIEAHEALACNESCHVLAEKTSPDKDEEKVFEPVKGGVLDALFKIDADDKRIIMYLQGDPEITHTEIGHRIGKSQPAVGERVAKLMRKKVLGMQKGINFKHATEMNLIQVAIVASDTAAVMEKLHGCTSTILAFRTTGERSIVAYLAGPTLDEVEEMVDSCIRADDRVIEVETATILTYAKDLILPFAFESEYIPGVGCAACSATATTKSTLPDYVKAKHSSKAAL
jgi:DNA-binding Lrp family transcriptional regulator